MNFFQNLSLLGILLIFSILGLIVATILLLSQHLRLQNNLLKLDPSEPKRPIKKESPSPLKKNEKIFEDASIENITSENEPIDLPKESYFHQEDSPPDYKSFFKALLHNIKMDRVPDLGAQTTYYLLLAMFPFFIVLLSVLQYTPLEADIIIQQLSNLLPEEAHSLIFGTISEVFTESSGALLSFGLVAALWSSLKGANALIKGVNSAYNVEETRHFVKVKGIALLTTLGVPIVIIFAFFFIVFGEVIGTYVFNFFGLSDYFIRVWNTIRYPVPIGVMIIFFTVFYKFAPNKKLRLRDVFWGALFTVVFWLVASLGFSYYINNFSNYSAIYGSLGGIVVVLLWLYISSIIIVLGAEVNVVLHRFREAKKKRSP